MSETTRLVTAEELEQFPDDDYRYELVEGRLVRMSPVNFDHGRIVVQLAARLHGHLQNQPSGVVVTDVGFKLASNPDTVSGPDIAYLKKERVPAPGGRGFFKGAPDLVIEVLSPGDRPGEMRDKVEGYLTRGAAVVVVIDPDDKTAAIFRPRATALVLRSETDVLDLGDVIPGFRCQLREIFH
jgi:Uma2 family endonuclease